MQEAPKTSMPVTGRVLALLALLCAAIGPAAAAYLNTTAGGVLRPGVYGRIEIGRSAPPPLIYPRPVIASRTVLPANVKPVYLYVPPGQVRRWERHCAKYRACDLPVYFVRMDNSPSKLGRWKARSELAHRDPDLALRTMGGPPGYRD
ncbi:hypothetical protein ACFPOE_10580 [Caenimonas terrae]|uniref:Uncharacterized protein n=1 Tax=Caenimonas terrae TaxID=696074 RepID=A0ABW0NFU8_9BURK